MRVRILRSFSLGDGVDTVPGEVLDVQRVLAVEAVRLGRAVRAPESAEPVSEEVDVPPTPAPKKWGRK